MVPAFYPAMAYGGTVAVCYDLSRELARRGHGVTVYTSDTLDKYHRQKSRISEIDGVKVYYFKNLSNRLAWHRLVFTPGMAPQLRNEMKSFDIIHLHGFRNFQNMLAHHYARKYDIPYVLQVHGSLPGTIEKQRLNRLYDWVWGNRILKDASKVMALTKTEANQYRDMGVDVENIEIVPNGINLSEYEKLPKRGEFRREYSIGDDEKIILYIGRLYKSKGIRLLIRVFVDLLGRLDNARLVLVGQDDGYQSVLQELVEALELSDKVLFTGFVTNDEKMAAFVDADVFVTPSFSGFPITFLESCTIGLPIVTTVRGDALEWIDNRVGYVTTYNKDDLLRNIVTILTDEATSKRFSTEAKRLVRERFSWNRIVERIENLYFDIAR